MITKVSVISAQKIISTMNELINAKTIPTKTAIAIRLGICPRSLTRLAKRYDIQLPTAQPQRPPPVRSRTYLSSPVLNLSK